MRVALWSGIPVVVAVLLTLLSRHMGVAWGCGITGAAVVLLGTFVLIGDQWEWFRQAFNRISSRFCAIEKGLAILRDDSAKKRELGESRELGERDPGFQEILKVIAKRRPGIECTEISGIHCGCTAGFNMGEGSVTYEIISLRPQGSSPSDPPDPPNALAPREAVEQWLHDARVRSLSSLGFSIVAFGVSLGLVSFVMQALASANC